MATKKKKKSTKSDEAIAETSKSGKAGKEKAPKGEKPAGRKNRPVLTGRAAKLYDKLQAIEETYKTQAREALDALAAELPEDVKTFALEDGTQATMCERDGVYFLRTNNPVRGKRAERKAEVTSKKKVGKKKTSKK